MELNKVITTLFAAIGDTLPEPVKETLDPANLPPNNVPVVLETVNIQVTGTFCGVAVETQVHYDFMDEPAILDGLKKLGENIGFILQKAKP